MPRLPSGVYEKPFPNVAPDTTIESAVFNGNTADVEQDLNTARPVVAGGTGATNAADARDNLDAERAAQVVTNYDAHVWEIGSFYAASTATAPPVAAHAFAGIVYGVIDEVTPANNKLVVEARDLDDTGVPGLVWVREKIGAGAWSAWTKDSASDRVAKAGDTMTGDLEIEKVIPQLILDRTDSQRATIVGQRGGLARWDIDFGNGDAEGGAADGSNFAIHRFSNAGAFIGNALVINRATAAADFAGNVTFAGTITVNGTTTLTGAVVSDVNIGKVSPTLYLSKTASGQAASIIGRSGANAQRWTMEFGSGDAEDGVPGNAGGSSFILHRYRNDGGYLGQALNISRATGLVTINGGMSLGAPITSDVTITKSVPLLTLNTTIVSRATIQGQRSGADMWHIDLGDGSGNFMIQRFNPGYVGAALQILQSDGSALFSGMVNATQSYMGRHGQGGATSYPFNFTWSSPSMSAWIQTTNIGVVQIVSDYRVKENVLDLTSMWDVVKALRPISYTIADWMPPWELEAQTKRAAERGSDVVEPFVAKDARVRWGFIAHELQETTVETAATGFKDAPRIIQSPDPMTILAALTKVVQELIARVEALEAP